MALFTTENLLMSSVESNRMAISIQGQFDRLKYIDFFLSRRCCSFETLLRMSVHTEIEINASPQEVRSVVSFRKEKDADTCRHMIELTREMPVAS